MRAGTLVSRKDVMAVERSSRRAFFAIRRASETRTKEERLADKIASSPPGGSRQQTRDDGVRRGRCAWVTGSQELGAQDEGDRDRLRRCLPSVESMDRELDAIRRADAAMRKEQLAQV